MKNQMKNGKERKNKGEEKNVKSGSTSEQSFQIRLAKQKQTEREKARRATQLSWGKRAKDFLESDSVAAQTTKVALALVVAAGILTTLTVAPGLTVLARHYKRSKYYSEKQMRSAVQNLRRRGYIETSHDKNEPRIRLTKKGEEYFQKMLFEESRLTSQAEWDGKWRFVLFDIPVEYTKAREALRFRLKALGFFQYQKSVWAYPYPCKDEILFVSDHFNIGRFVEILDATGLSDDAVLKKHFKLP
ncbi:MAG: hypothetical protein HYT94_02160 [Parcubacteria group bacterium]|nr:hypothetical protein [Parcubacteria group bacterium]